MLIRGEGVAAAVATAAQRSIARDFSYDRGSRMDVFHGENVSLGQRSPIMRIFLFFLGFFQCAVRYPPNALPPSYIT